MPLSLRTQREAQQARRQLTDCYICGLPLPAGLSAAERRQMITPDHVIPRSILRMANCKAPDAWPLKLNVHSACEDGHKDMNDQLAKLFLKMASEGVHSWAPEELGEFRRRCSVTYAEVDQFAAQPVIEMDDSFIRHPFLWARGLHAALYGRSLPPDVWQWTGLPVPTFLAGDPDSGDCVREERQRTEVVLGTLARALDNGQADEVSLRAGVIAYYCTWTVPPDEANEWWCLWALDLPGTHKWSSEVRGRSAPWHGMYILREKPPGASSTEMFVG